MSLTVPEPLNRLLAAYARGQSLVLLFDYDGTLTPLVAHPRLARLGLPTRSMLQQLSARPRVFVGIISGRMIADVKQMAGIPGLYYGGTCGLELDLRGELLAHPRAMEGAELIKQAAGRLQAVAARFPGAWVKRKPLGLTLHYREVAASQVRDLCCQARQTFRSEADQWRVLAGPLALEATPALGWAKASAMRMILFDVGGDCFPLYAGDDANDSDALESTRLLGGISVGIGPRAPATAEYRLSSLARLHSLLARLLALLDSPRRSRSWNRNRHRRTTGCPE